MKITETWQNRDAFIEACKEHDACIEEFNRLIRAKTKAEWLEIIARNFGWCVIAGILEEWLPDRLDVTELYCSNCTGLTKLPKLPNVTKLYCYGCTGLTELPDLPNVTWLDCGGCTGLTSLPDLPKVTRLNYGDCPGLKEDYRK